MGAGDAFTGRDRIGADIERLEKARDEGAGTGIRKLIEAWIEEQKQKLASGKNPN